MRLNVKTKLRHKAQHAQHAHRILAKTCGRITNNAQHLIVQIAHTTVVIQYHLALHIVVQRIDGHVAARGIAFNIAIDIVTQHAAVLVHFLIIQIVRAERRYLDQIALVQHMHDAKTSTNDARATEQFQNLFRTRIGRNVKILRNMPEHQVAHRATHNVGIKARFSQCFADHARRLRDVARIDAVLFRRI